MSSKNGHEEALLGQDILLEDLHGDAGCNDSGLVFMPEDEKFGISNENGNILDNVKQSKPLVDTPRHSQSPENDSLCSFASSSSAIGTGGQLSLKITQTDSKTCSQDISTSSEPKNTSDSEQIESQNASVTENSTYMNFYKDKERNDSLSIASDSSSMSSNVQDRGDRLSRVSHNRGASSPAVMSTPLQRQTSQEWVTFEERQKANTDLTLMAALHSSSPSKPPDIPSRKRVPSNPTASQVKEIDLLSMDTDMLTQHLDGSPILSRQGTDGPPIPERVSSPKSLACSPLTKTFDLRLPPPHAPSPSSSIRRRTRGISATTPTNTAGSGSLSGPPIPPRKDISLSGATSSVSDTFPPSPDHIASNSWVTFDEQQAVPEMEEQTKKSTSSMTTQSSHSSQLGKDLIHSSVSSLETDNKSSDMVKDEDSSNEHDLQWKASAATSPTGSLKSAKKKKGGYQHLPSDSDEEGKKGSTEDSDGVEIKITDLSPEKPLSRWAPIPNDVDDIGGSSGDVSAHNSLDDDPLPGDLDDDIFTHDNRLSADISGLKGFNRADKGSQNNLVDFSVSAEKFNTSRAGSICNSEDDPELETVFDMTAQGDSLKRKRKKKVLDISADDQTTLSTPTYQIGIANDTLHSSSTAENSEASCFEVPAVKNDVKSESANTSRNPFWRSSPLGDTVSLASNTSESNPFDRIQFHSAATTTPAPASSKSSSGIPALPPPPTSTKSRNLSGSSRRTRTRESPKESLVYDTQTLVSRESANTKTTFKLDCAKDDLIQHSVAGTSSESTTELDGISLLDLNKCDEKDDKEKNLKPDVQADEYLLHSGADSQPETEPVSVPGTSQKDSTILETTLSILDVFSKPPLDEQSSINTNIKTYPVLQSPTVFPDLRENSLNSITKLQKPVESPSLESPQEIAKHLNAKKIQFLKEEDIISNNTEWNMLMRFPRQKHLMSSRKWVKIFIRLKQDKVTYPTLELYHTSSSKDPFYFVELARQDWQLTEPVLQARFQTNDNVQGMEPGVRKKKVHAVKILRVYYKEKHAFGSAQDKYLTRIPVGFKHSVKGKQEVKLGTENYSELLSLILAVKNASFNANKRLALVKDVANINDDEHKSLMMYHSRDEIVFDLRDECRAVVSANGEMEACSLMVHVNVTSFLSGDPMATVTFNDIKVESREVVRRDDIIPSSNDKWVEINDVSVHRCSNAGYDDQSASITFYPPDSCRFELARLTCPHREPGLPVILRASVQVIGCQVKLRCVLRSNIGHSANRSTLTQVPCEDMSLRFPIPDNWVPAFRRSGRLHLKSVHSKRIVKRPPTTLASNRSDAVVTSAVMEASVGSAKYEVAHGAVVWRLKRFPEKNAAQNSPRVFSCALQLASDRDLPNADVIDDVKRKFCWCEVEYTMVSNTASSVCVRSVHLPNTDRAEKFTCYSAHYFYKVGISVNHEREDGRGCTVQ